MRTIAAIALLALLGNMAHAQSLRPKPYSLNPGTWVRAATPAGEVFTCTVCEAQVQVQIDAGPPLPPDAKFKTNEQFLASLKTTEQQRQFADNLIRSQIPLQSGFTIRVEKTGLTKIGGVDAFQFMAVVEMKPNATRDTTMLLIHQNRIIKISVNYHEGTFGPKARDALTSLFSSIKFL